MSQFYICHKDMSNEDLYIAHADWKEHAYKAKQMIGGKVRYIYDKVNSAADRISGRLATGATRYAMNAEKRAQGYGPSYRYDNKSVGRMMSERGHNFNSTRGNLSTAARALARGTKRNIGTGLKSGRKLAAAGLSRAAGIVRSIAGYPKKRRLARIQRNMDNAMLARYEQNKQERLRDEQQAKNDARDRAYKRKKEAERLAQLERTIYGNRIGRY